MVDYGPLSDPVQRIVVQSDREHLLAAQSKGDEAVRDQNHKRFYANLQRFSLFCINLTRKEMLLKLNPFLLRFYYKYILHYNSGNIKTYQTY